MNNSTKLGDTPIAIVGLGALFPQSTDLSEFWSNVVEARDCIEDVPATHWKIGDYYDPDPTAPDKTYAKRGGFLPFVDFDPMEFGLPPNQLEVTGVLQLLSLVVAKQTLADAGAPRSTWYDPSRTGCILGVIGTNSLAQPLTSRLQTPVLKEVVRSCGLSERDAEEIAAKFEKAYAPWEENSFPGMLGNVIAGRIANRFDLGGTNCTVDAACASSMAAVHMAVSELVSGRADLMITGGCDAENTILMYMCFSKTPALSKSEVIRPFDERSDGTMIGEGIGMLALKRLADAERDGDRIYAVLCGIGSSSDGRFKSIYAPREEGQTVALERAYADAGIEPEQVGLLECHGTGTAVGDHTEVSALRAVFGAATTEKQFCAIGSVKSQIGHTKATAGAAGLIKATLALHQKVLPPTINVTEPSRGAEFPKSPFWVNTSTRPWLLEPRRTVRRAGSSSFGFGGTNFHCVLEEYESGVESAVLHQDYRVHVWHATDAHSLLAAMASDPRGGAGEQAIPAEHARLAVVARTAAELDALRDTAAERLRAAPTAESFELPGGTCYRRRAGVPGKVAALFAGQGSQYVGMGARAAVAVPTVRAALDAASLMSDPSEPLSRVLYPPQAFDDETAAAQEAALRRTDYAQPAIGALAAGQYRYLTELGFDVQAALGHSFGELTALWAAGVFDDEAFHALAWARGTAMAHLPDEISDRGTMAALHCDPEALTELLTAHPDVVICNINAPEQTVVGGGTRTVRDFVTAARTAGLSAELLPVSAAFHTPYVAHAVEVFGSVVAEVPFAAPAFPVYADTAGAEYGENAEHNRRVLVEQITQPVAFAPRVRQLYEAGFRVFVEFGPKSVLSGLVRRTLAEHEDVVVLAADAGPGGDGDRSLKQLAARLAVLGLPLAGFDRYSAPVREIPESKGMRISLNGSNFVPEERRRSYQDALENGYRITPPVNADGHVDGSHDGRHANGNGGNGNGNGNGNGYPPSRPVEPAATISVTPTATADMVADHFAMHREYLAGQLRVAERLSGILEYDARRGSLDERTLAGLVAVSDQSVSIGQAHSHASEVQLGLAYLEAGLGAVAPVRHPLERVSRPEPVPGPVLHRPELPPAAAPLMPAAGYVPATPDAQAPAAIGSIPETEFVPATTVHVPPPAPIAPVPAPEHTAVAASAPVAAPAEDVATVENVAATVEQALLEVVADKTGYPTDMLELTMDVEADLGIDSIKRVEIMGALQDRFPDSPQAGPERMGELRTLGGIATFLAEGVGGGVHPKADGAPVPGIARMQARLVELPAVYPLAAAYGEQSVAVLAGTDSALIGPVASALAASGFIVRHGTESTRWDTSDRVDLVIFFAPDDPVGWPESVAALEAAQLLAAASQRCLERAARRDRAAFVTVSRVDGVHGLSGARDAAGLLGGLPGLTKTLAIEAPSLFCRALDLSPELPIARAVERVLAEISDADTGPAEVGIATDGRRRQLVAGPGDGTDPLLPQGNPISEPTEADLFVITGGGRGVTAACAVELARRYRNGLLLLGRSPLADEPEWAAGVPESDLKGAIIARARAAGDTPTPRDVEHTYRTLVAGREIRGTLDRIHAAGATAEYLAVDITDTAATAAALAPYRSRITGLVHGAGVIADRAIIDQRRADVAAVLATKVAGLRSVLDAVDAERLRHVVLFSSLAGFFGNLGQSGYASANAALTRIAATLRRRQPGTRVTAMIWGAWEGGMVTPELARMFTERGVPLIPLARGADFLAGQFAAERAGDVVCVVGPNQPPTPVAPSPVPTGPTVLGVPVTGLAWDPVLRDHAIDGAPVLLATAAVGAILGAAQRLRGAETTRLTGFSVLKGVVFEPDSPEQLAVTVTGEQVVVADQAGRPRFRASVPADQTLTGPAVVTLPAFEGFEPVTAYADGVLFHGPILAGIIGTAATADGGLVALCRPVPEAIGGGLFRAGAYAPEPADLLLQAIGVLAHRMTGLNALPAGIGAVEVRAPLPIDAEFLVVVSPLRITGAQGQGDALACTRDGRVLLRFADVRLISDAALAPKFRRNRIETIGADPKTMTDQSDRIA
ncbi:SDR family NAD(P)-dependent oxidoreductase [Nocardia sp. NPDC005366]|uniref:SDR family NAD(P)-dependent oxidoreductase n=1 Tax=Nocardia sp. NPDC005366 TaxID=3156878 RepID=UPI0033BBCB52